MEGRERALMRASVSLQLLISTLKKHDLDAPLTLDDPRIKELFSEVLRNLEQAEASEELNNAVSFLDRHVVTGMTFRKGSIRGLLTMLLAVEAKLREVGSSRFSLRVV